MLRQYHGVPPCEAHGRSRKFLFLQAPQIQTILRRLNAFTSLAFQGVSPIGWYIYEATFAQGKLQVTVAPLTADDKACLYGNCADEGTQLVELTTPELLPAYLRTFGPEGMPGLDALLRAQEVYLRLGRPKAAV